MRKAWRHFSWIFSTIVWLSITSAQASEWKDKAEAEGKPFVIRQRIPRDATITIQDAIRGRIEWDSNTVDDPVLMGCLQKVEAAAQRGADLTAKLMAFARKSVLQPRAIDISALIHETTELLSGSLPRNIQIHTRIQSGLPPVHGDPTQLQQLFARKQSCLGPGGIENRRRVSLRQHEAIVIGILRGLGVVAHLGEKQRGDDLGG